MKVYGQIEKSSCKTAVALGFFDGIHLGHRAVIESAVKCRSKGLSPVVFTFSQNPSSVITGKKIPELIQPELKCSILNRMMVETLYAADFKEVMNLSSREFVKNILADKLNAKKVFCGFNYHFGSGGQSDAESLREICSEYDIEAVTLPAVLFKEEPISSTRIRHALKQGKITDVTKMLGREFSFKIEVRKGNQLGRQLGTPTFNQPMPDGFILPRFGVYASSVDIGGDHVCGVTNIGIKPTVGSDGPLAETWMPKMQCGELYGKTIEVKLLDFIRGETKFNSIFELKAAILDDGEKALKIFNGK